MYSNGNEEMHTVHNQVMATINLFRMRQERAIAPEFSRAIHSNETGVRSTGTTHWAIGQAAWAILKKEGVMDTLYKQLEDMKNKAAEEYHAILFLHLAD